MERQQIRPAVNDLDHLFLSDRCRPDDYLLRDGHFSGVKCGIYDYNRLFMSIVPVEEQENCTRYLQREWTIRSLSLLGRAPAFLAGVLP